MGGGGAHTREALTKSLALHKGQPGRAAASESLPQLLLIQHAS